MITSVKNDVINQIKEMESKKKLTKAEKEELREALVGQMLVVRRDIGNATLKKDIKTKQSELKKIERQLKKL